jgi:hypothetical protein
MRERVATVGGELGTGPAPGGGFLVDAVLPLPEEAPATPVAGPDGHRCARTLVGPSETMVDQ